jgi:hypothetical protein
MPADKIGFIGGNAKSHCAIAAQNSLRRAEFARLATAQAMVTAAVEVSTGGSKQRGQVRAL